MGDVQKSESLAKLRRICRFGVWVLIAAIAVIAAYLVACVAELAICLSDPWFVMIPLDHTATTLNILSSIASAVSGLLVCIMTYRIAMTISCEKSPFNHENVISMKHIAAVCMVTFAVILVLEVFLWATSPADNAQFDFPFQLAITGIVTYIFSLLFEYGAALQTESDEFL